MNVIQLRLNQREQQTKSPSTDQVKKKDKSVDIEKDKHVIGGEVE